MKKALLKIVQSIVGDKVFDWLYWWYFFRHQQKAQADRPNVLVINHVFDQDLQALRLANDHFNFIVINALALRIAGDHLFPRSVESYKVYNSPELVPVKQRYRTIMDRFVSSLIRRYNIKAVLSPSDNFFYVREFVLALQAKHIPFYVIDKEGTICPAYFTHFAQYIKEECPLLADHIFVWSERQKEFWIKSGVESQRVTITGQPRSDFWKQPQRWKKKKDLGIPGLRPEAKMLLFFSYDPWAYTPDYMIEKGEMNWLKLRQDTRHQLFTYARQHPEHDIVMKTHPQQPDIENVRQAIASSGCKNIHLATGPELSNHLIVSADCIVGFQTTALIEAMVTDKPIIYTFWDEAKEKWSRDLIPFHQTKGIMIAESPDALLQDITSAMVTFSLSSEARDARDAFLTEYFTLVDGRRAKATLDAVKQQLSSHG